MDQVAITSFYRFLPLTAEQVLNVKSRLETLAEANALRGLCLIGTEGINSTVSGPPAGIHAFKTEARDALACQDLDFKDSVAGKHPFLVFKVKVKDEIVSLGKPELRPNQPRNNHLTPQQWQAAMQDPDSVVLDTRNGYEVELGKFKGAVDFALKEFNEFPERVKNSGIAKDKKVLMYCTGGIRCEKAILEMNQQGYENVFQLEGGILNYLNEFPERDFNGECFIFDYRVALDQHLQPTKNYRLCPHCGQPAKQPVTCVKCGREDVICSTCSRDGVKTCSKNCAHHAEIGSGSMKIHLPELKKRQRDFDT